MRTRTYLVIFAGIFVNWIAMIYYFGERDLARAMFAAFNYALLAWILHHIRKKPFIWLD